MVKTASPGTVTVDGTTFAADAVPDVFDVRDLDYRPRLHPLPAVKDVRPEDRFVMSQVGSSCTGHAVAAMINAVLAEQHDPVHVSPYLLYRLARRYDEFEGEADAGSSLRGALKGWYYHGAVPDTDWPNDPEAASEPDIDNDPAFSALAARRPLGAFYRVNTMRLDDLQSAVNELSALAVSAAIHDGWTNPTRWTDQQGGVHAVISRSATSKPLGGHAFCIVGYDEVGFLVQNSWGKEWGKGGFATLPYDDWLDSAYDAWVARPGVYSIISERTRRTLVANSAGKDLVNAPGPNLARLASHVVNLGNDGRLSRTGRATSSPAQLDKVFTTMSRYHRSWHGLPPRILLYAHGGLVSEQAGLAIAQRQLNWWLSHHVYPVTFAWESGPVETLLDQVGDLSRGRLPAGGIGFNLVEQFDRLVEGLARRGARWMWDQMKQNAHAGSAPLGPGPEDDQPGASLLVARLRTYLDQLPTDAAPEIHLVGHSAGSIFMVGVLDRLVDAKIPVTSLTYLAPALRTDEWVRRVLPHLEAGRVERFSSFAMNAARELDDTCGAGGHGFYQKSLLYLVSRALETPAAGEAEVPLVGMEHFVDAPVEGTTLRQSVDPADLVWSPQSWPINSRTDSATHGGFDDDSATMTSVAMRILDTTEPLPGGDYQAYRPATVVEPPPDPTSAPPTPEELASTPPLATAEVEETSPVPTTTTSAEAAKEPMPMGAGVPGESPAEEAEPEADREVAPAESHEHAPDHEHPDPDAAPDELETALLGHDYKRS